MWKQGDIIKNGTLTCKVLSVCEDIILTSYADDYEKVLVDLTTQKHLESCGWYKEAPIREFWINVHNDGDTYSYDNAKDAIRNRSFCFEAETIHVREVK